MNRNIAAFAWQIVMVCFMFSTIGIPTTQSALHTSRSLKRLAPSSGSIRGTVTFSGKIPKKLTMTAVGDAACGKEHPLDRLLLGAGNGVQSTLIFIKNPPAASTTSMKQASITQTSCRFWPHLVVAARGSSIEFKNEDPVLHNCHGYFYSYAGNRAERSTAFNIAQPNEGQRSLQELRKQGMINVECDAGHTWMSAWIWVTANPYAVVTDERGSFSLDGLPAGTYTVVMWHEGWGQKESGVDGRPVFSDPVVQEREVVVGDGASAQCNFDLR